MSKNHSTPSRINALLTQRQAIIEAYRAFYDETRNPAAAATLVLAAATLEVADETADVATQVALIGSE